MTAVAHIFTILYLLICLMYLSLTSLTCNVRGLTLFRSTAGNLQATKLPPPCGFTIMAYKVRTFWLTSWSWPFNSSSHCSIALTRNNISIKPEDRWTLAHFCVRLSFVSACRCCWHLTSWPWKVVTSNIYRLVSGFGQLSVFTASK